MGRSVSTPQGAAVVVYTTTSSSYYCHTCNAQAEDHETCTGCETAGRTPDIRFDDDITQLNWRDDLETLSADLRAAYPSLLECDEWLGREDHAILRNDHAHVTVSEYCGLVAVCLVPRAPEYQDTSALSQHWCSVVEAHFRRVVAGVFGEQLARIGTFSNGEAVFKRIDAAQ